MYAIGPTVLSGSEPSADNLIVSFSQRRSRLYIFYSNKCARHSVNLEK